MSGKLVLRFAFLDEERPDHKRRRQQSGEEPVHDLLESLHVHPPSNVLFVRASPDLSTIGLVGQAWLQHVG